MNIKIKKQDIFDYVAGISNYDAIEKIIDPVRYEVFDCGIYDNSTKTMLKQSGEYEGYCYRVSQLRKNAKNIPVEELNQLCLEIEESAPKEISLDA